MDDFYNRKAAELFGLNYVYPWQRLVIGNILEGMGYYGSERQEEAPRRNLVILPTGAGKSLCFLMPALLGKGITVVLYPLLALLNDQARRLKERGHEPALFRGGQTRKERESLWKMLEEGKSRFILTNPETACREEFMERLAGLPLSHLVVDEAHTISQWGLSFRQGLLATGELVERGIFPVVTAFTATASPPMQEDIGRLLFAGKDFHRIAAHPDRPNIAYHVLYTPFAEPALEELCRREEKPILIFCRTRAGAEETARFLDRRIGGSVRVRFYHAGLEREEKKETEEWFLQEDRAILCATSAYGMGVDARALRTVIHRDTPFSVESYIQEAGRAGRSGDESRAILLAPPRREGGEEKMDGYVYGRTTCRRTLLMDAMGWESEYCGGCDICTPSNPIPETAGYADRFNSLFYRYNGVFTRKEWIDFLKGYAAGGRFVRGAKGFSLLKNWERESIRSIFDYCVREDILRIPRRGLRKNRVFVKGRL
jgi:ATP-dependent DNA helicase RecQ